MNYSVPFDTNANTNTDTNSNIFYTLKVNENLGWDNIITYYIYLFGYVGISSSFIYFILMVSNIVDAYFERNETDEDAEDVEEEVETKEEEIPYEMKWFVEFDDKGDKGDEGVEEELTEEFVNDLCLNTVTETTPRGDVLMYYSSKLGTFVYHSHTKEIPYNYLETVARKYVIEYNCKKLYIDIRKEYEKGVQKYKEIKAKEEEEKNAADETKEKENKKKQIFANFKTYNRKGEVHNKQNDKIYILKEQANRYSYRGKIEEYSEAKVESCLDKKVLESMGDKRSEEEKKVDDIDFASFKKMNMNMNTN